MYQSKNWMEAYTKCPFYICEYKRSITCEGFEDGMESNMNKFKTEEEKSNFVKQYCCSMNYEKCKLCRMIMEKYKEK